MFERSLAVNRKFWAKLIAVLGMAFAIAVLVPAAHADIIYEGSVTIGGTGFGNVGTILTYQGTGGDMGLPESGCVGVSSTGVLNTTGPSMCYGGNVGGMEKPPAGFPHNQTFLVSNAAQIGVIFNADQPSAGTIDLTNLTISLFNATGEEGFTSGAFAGTSLDVTHAGIGNSGFLFELDATQAAAAQTAINGGFDYLGLSATDSSALGGPETFFLTSVAAVPEPGSPALLGLGVMGLLGLGLRRKQVSA